MSERLLHIDVVHNKKTTYIYKGVEVKVIGGIMDMFELEIIGDVKPYFEPVEDFLNNAVIKGVTNE